MSKYKDMRYEGGQQQVLEDAYNELVEEHKNNKNKRTRSSSLDFIPNANSGKVDPGIGWTYVDGKLKEAIYRYSKIKTRDQEHSVFIDLIIKLNICRAYACNQNFSIVMAKTLLGTAKILIDKIKDPKDRLEIIKDKQAR